MQSQIPATREAAKIIGAKKYISNPCKRGHDPIRYVSDQSCVECKTIATNARKDRAKKDPELMEKILKWQRESKRRERSTPEGKLKHYERNKAYVEANREKVWKYYRDRRVNNPDVRMALWCRSTLHKVLSRTNKRKDARCVELLGYSGLELRLHIEKQFTKGMNWDRMGKEIHIDHITPVAEFIRLGETDPAVINCLSNLRPMWAKDNIAKSDSITELL